MPRHLIAAATTAICWTFLALALAPREVAGAGINLSWDACGAAGTELETFACNTNSGTAFSMVGSFTPPAGISQFLGLNGELRIASTTLPNWWKHESGQCRGTTGLAVDFASAPSGACLTPWTGQQVGGFTYQVDGFGPNTARLVLSGAVPIDQMASLSASSEYEAFRVNVQRTLTTGAGACAGCDQPVRITLEQIQLFQPPAAANDPILTAPIARKSVIWQASPGNPPAITSVTPLAGAPGSVITIDGAAFTGTSFVRFGGTSAAFTVVSDVRITATVPASGRSGPVTVVTPLGTATSAGSFTVSPRVTEFLPKQAPVGAPVRIRGANFGNASAVRFNGVAASFGIVDDSTLVANAVPAGATSGPLSVSNPGGTGVADSVFRVGPASGALNLAWDDCGAAGTPIKTFACNTNSGAAFTLVGSFVPPPGVNELLGLNADIGVHAAVLPDWWRIGSGGCRTNVLSGSFNFTTGPSTCDDPWEGLSGGGVAYQIGHYGPQTARIVVTGSMPEANAVAVDPHREYYGFKVLIGRARTVSDGACAGCDVPVRLTLHQMQLVQRASVGSNPVITLPYQSNSAYWQAVPGPLPEIDALSPTAGAPGTLVTLTGQHFTGATEVKLGPQLTAFTLVSDTEIRSTVPASARTNPFTVRTPSGVGGSDSLFIVAPRITALVPSQAPVGFTIGIRGANFTRTTAVQFNGVAATFTAEDDSLIRATVPPGATAGPVTVTNAGGTASSSTFVVGPLPPGTVNLSWTDCGLAGTALQTFACNTNTGAPFTAVASFDPPPDVDELAGLTGEIRVNAYGSLPDWWRHGSGQCRGATGLTSSMDFTGAVSACANPWAGRSVSAAVAYAIDAYGPGTARVLVTGGIADGSPVAVDPGTEYNGFKVSIARTATTGASSCAACTIPVSLELEQIQLLQASGGYDPVLATPKDRVTILWQDEPGPPPDIASFTPVGGGAGTLVTILGTSFTEASVVRFNGTGAAFSVIGDGEIRATAPAGVRTGPIQVATPRGQDTSDSLFLASPMIQYFVPRQGPVGTSVALRGVNFNRVASVTFGGVPATFTVVNDSLLRAVVPPTATTGPIEVAHTGGSAVSAIDFVVGPLLEGAVNLSWLECGTAGTPTLTYDCGGNLGTAALVASFTPSPDVHEMIGLTGEIRVHSTAALPDWWKHGNGQCRGTSGLSTSVSFPPASFSACTNPWAGRSATANHTYSIGHYGANSARILVNAGVPVAQRFALSPAQQYYAFTMNVARTSSTCVGCPVPVGLTLESIQLLQSAELQHDPVLTDERDRKSAHWQAEPGPAPSIASFAPAAGAPGALVTISGANFTGASEVRFGTLGAVFEVRSDHDLLATVPANAVTAPLSVISIQGTGTSSSAFVVAPRIVSFAPRQAPAGYAITIRGQNFGGTTGVEFGGGASAAFTVVSATELRATVPGAAVTGPIRVENPGGAATSAEDFIVGPLPPGFINLAWNDCGPAGSEIQSFACNTNFAGPFVLVGSFVPPDGVTEMFGLAGEIRVVSNSTVLPDWWKHGAGQCRSTTGLGTSFDFTSGPTTCEDFWMGQASGGHTYEIGFGGANAARLVVTGSIPYDQRRAADPANEYYAFKVQVNTANTTACSGCSQGLRLTLRQIQLFQAKPLNFDPVITTPFHSRDAYWQFVPGPAPEIVDFTPRAGAPGVPVTIFGSNFTGTTSVRFGPASAVFSVTSDGRIDCTLPSGAISGPIEITSLQGATLTDSIFVVAPDLTGFSPFQAPVGHEIRLFGINFLRTTAVTFNGTPASAFRVLDNSDLRATVPPGTTHGPIRVDNPGGFDVSASQFQVGPVGVGQGVNLSWNDCGAAGVQNMTFACNANTGAPFTAIASFVPPTSLPEYLGFNSQIDLRSQTPTLPEWWKHGSSFCRGTTGLAVSFDFTAGPFTCFDIFAGQAAGGFVYEYPFSSDRGRVRVTAAVPFDNRGPVDEGVEYYAYKLNVLRSRSTGTGSCSGCDVPMCLVLDHIQLFQPPERDNDPILMNPSDRNFVTWQSATLCASSTPVQVSLVTTETTPTSARVVWQLEGVESATVQRSDDGERWHSVATVIPDGQHRIVFDDFDVVPGATYAYRLGFQGDAGMLFAGETEVRIPGFASSLALLGVRDEAGGVAVSFTLPAAADAAVAIFDLGGRRWAERRLEGLKAGEHEVRVAGPRALAPGVYFARLVQQGASASRRFVVVK
jgi:hypothetical protein